MKDAAAIGGCVFFLVVSIEIFYFAIHFDRIDKQRMILILKKLIH